MGNYLHGFNWSKFLKNEKLWIEPTRHRYNYIILMVLIWGRKCAQALGLSWYTAFFLWNDSQHRNNYKFVFRVLETIHIKYVFYTSYFILCMCQKKKAFYKFQIDLQPLDISLKKYNVGFSSTQRYTLL